MNPASASTPDATTIAEQSVIGSLLIDGSARSRINGLAPEDFQFEQHREIFIAIGDELDDAGTCDAVTVYERLERNGSADRAGGLEYLTALVQNTPSAASIKTYARKVQEAALRRRRLESLRAACDAAERGDDAAAMAHVDAIRDKAAARPSLTGAWAGDIRPHLAGRYLIKRLFNVGDSIQVNGDPNSGKSAAMLDISCHLAAGLPDYRGRRLRGCPVAYFALESPVSIDNRVIAWCQNREIDRSALRLYVAQGMLDLRNQASVAEALALLKSESVRMGPFGLIVIDTQARATPGANENDSADMSAVIASSDRLRMETGAAVARVHHFGKDPKKGGRGHSSQLGEVDVSIDVADRCLKLTKVRDGAVGESIPFDLKVIELGKDEDGDPVTAVVAIKPDTDRPRRARKLEGNALIAFELLRDLIAEKDTMAGGGASVPEGKKVANIADWRTRFYAKYGASTDTDTARRAFNRARERLIDPKDSYVGIADPLVWIW